MSLLQDLLRFQTESLEKRLANAHLNLSIPDDMDDDWISVVSPPPCLHTTAALDSWTSRLLSPVHPILFNPVHLPVPHRRISAPSCLALLPNPSPSRGTHFECF